MCGWLVGWMDGMNVLVLHHGQYEQGDGLNVPAKQSESPVLLHHTATVVRQVCTTVLTSKLAASVMILVQQVHC